MKKILSVLVCFIMIFGTLPVSAASQKDLLNYGSFEGRPANAFSATMRPTEYSDDVAHTGNISIKAIGGDHGHQQALVTFQWPILEKNKTYHLSTWLYSAGDVGTFSFEVAYYIDGKRNTITLPGGAVPIGKWTKYEANFTVATDATSPITSSSVVVRTSGIYDMYIDDMELYVGEKDIAPMKEWNDADPEKQEIKGETLELYVDGNAAPGGDGSKEKPFDSIYTARDYIRTINKNMTKNIAVNIKEGFYEMTETFLLTEEDSGSNGYYIIWRADGDGEVVLSGGKRITGWQPSEIPGVYKVSNKNDNMRNLFVNNTVAQRARLENYVTPLDWYDDVNDATSHIDGVILPKGIIKNPEAATNLELFKLITFRGNWSVKGKAIETESGTAISFAQPAFSAQEKSNYSILTWNVTDDFRLENALEFLDKPGEWYQDIDTDTLYYMPKEGEDINSAEVVAPVLENMVDVAGSSPDNKAHHIAFSGITFAHGANDYTSIRGRATHQASSLYTFDDTYGYQTGWYIDRAALNFNNAGHILFEDNVVKHMSSVGINAMTAVEEAVFNGNIFYQIASTGMTVGSSRTTTILDRDIIPRNITFSNNIVTETGFEYPASSAFQSFFANGVYVLNNIVYNTYYSGICVGWGWTTENIPQRRFNVIGNRIWNTNTFGTDGSCIYTLGDAPKSTAQYNYISYVPDEHLRPQFYHDNGSAHWYDYRNVVATGLPTGTNNWISPYCEYQHDIQIIECYTDHEKRSYVAEDTIESKTGFNPDASWSEEARYAISKSGLSAGYEHLLAKVPGWETQATKIKNVTLQTKEYGNATPVQLKTGGTATVTALYETYSGDLSFKDTFKSVRSTNEAVVKCNGTKITAVGTGIANVIAITEDNRELLITVTVNDKVEKMKLLATADTISVGDVTYLKYVLDTKYWSYTHANSIHEFTSSNPHIASVDDMGVVRGLKNGQTKLTLKVTYDGKVYTDSVTLMVKDTSIAADLSVDKYIYETSEANVDASIKVGSKKVNVTGKNASAAFENAAGAPKSSKVETEYTSEMRRIYTDGIIDDTLNAQDYLTEEQFVKMVETATGRTKESMNIKLQSGFMNRERMAYILSQAIKYTWANTMAGPTRMSYFGDKTDVSPEYIPYVTNIVKYELCFVKTHVNTFRPKDYATVAEASATIFRMLHPEDIRNAEYPEGWFNRAYEGEGTGRRAHTVFRRDDNKTVVDGSMGANGTALPNKPGNYKINLKATHNGTILEKNDFLFVYDKNDIYNSDEFSVAHIGDNASGIVLSENDKIRIISETGNVWDYHDVFSYVYKQTSDENYEVTTTIDSITNTNADAAAGIMLRNSTNSNAVKIDYRIKPSGDTFLCWRTNTGTNKDGATYFVSGKRLEFPATLRLVKTGTKFTAYYKSGDQWIEETSFEVPKLTGNIYAGLMLYSMTTASGKPCSAIFGDNYFGGVRQLANVVSKETATTQKPTELQKPTVEENLTTEKPKVVELNRNRFVDIFKNGNMERGVDAWSANGGKVSATDTAYKGTSAMAFSLSGDSGYTACKLSGLNKNRTYYIVFRAKADSTVSFAPYIEYNNGKGMVKSTAEYMTDMTADNSEWKEYIVKVNFEKTVYSPKLILYVNGKGNIYVDNVELLYQ